MRNVFVFSIEAPLSHTCLKTRPRPCDENTALWDKVYISLYPLSSFLGAGSRLQDWLELAGHADLLLLLADDALDGGGQAAGVPGEDQGVAVLAAAVVLQGAAGVGDGVVVIVSVNDPVVVTWRQERGERLVTLLFPTI